MAVNEVVLPTVLPTSGSILGLVQKLDPAWQPHSQLPELKAQIKPRVHRVKEDGNS
jgi:hypothetical protein